MYVMLINQLQELYMQATLKKSIKPVTFTITVVAKKVNENGTFSSFEVQSVTGSVKNNTFKVVAPPQAGGALYIKCETLEGMEVLQEGTATNAPKQKLF
jgi:hypothetical protein